MTDFLIFLAMAVSMCATPLLIAYVPTYRKVDK